MPFITKKSSNFPPWFSKELIDLFNHKKKLLTIYRSTSDSEDYSRFSRARSEFKALQRLSYQIFINNTANNIKNDPKCFFNYVNFKNNTSGFPSEMKYKHNTSDAPEQICNLFATFFKEVFKKPSITEYEHAEALNYVNISNLQLSPDSVQKYLQNLNTSKGAGPDEIPNKFLNDFSVQLSEILTCIFNNSLSSGVFPKFWKLSHIIPIFKEGDRADVENYRGISIISAIPKLFEKMVFDLISVEVYPFITHHQHGFFPQRSIQTNLVLFTHPTINWIELGLQVDVIHTDFRKAFD